jgi:hypothetical protein
LAGDCFLNIRLAVNAVLDFHVPLGTKVEEEDYDDRSEDDRRTPRVVCSTACHTNTGLWSNFAVGRIEEMDESSGNNDSCAKVPSKEVDIEGNMKTWHSFRDDREEGRYRGYDSDNERWQRFLRLVVHCNRCWRT